MLFDIGQIVKFKRNLGFSSDFILEYEILAISGNAICLKNVDSDDEDSVDWWDKRYVEKMIAS